jgi:hypothetical protein
LEFLILFLILGFVRFAIDFLDGRSFDAYNVVALYLTAMGDGA